MNSSLGQLTWALGIGGLMSFYGIVSIIVWIGGDKFGFPLNYRIVLIALILLTLPFALVIAFVASRQSKKKKKAKEEQDQQAASTQGNGAAAAPKAAPAPGAFGELNAGVEEVIQFLRSSNLGEGGKDAVYSLPWYIVAGAPRSGKTSLVLSSNLNFQTLPSQRQSELKVIRPTPNVDWRVTSEGVFFDTAGRYQTEGVDGDEWAALLESIKKARGNRPLDGMILVVDTDRILKSEERESEEMAKVLRARLDEVIQKLKVRFPVYLIFTHADAIEGFRDSFSTSKGEDKTLVWGATIPIDKSENAQAMFDGEYEILHSAVAKRRLLRLSAPFPPVRQLRIFNFPLHFGSARRKLGAFVNTLFRPNPFSENPFLRGYYFTAAPAAKAPSGVLSSGSPYFTERLFKDVILRDKDLVRTFLAQRQRAPIFGWFLTLLVLFITFVLLVMSGISLATNRQMLNDASARGEKLLEIWKSWKSDPANPGKSVLSKSEDETRREVDATENLRGLLVHLDDYERNSPPFYMRMGLYSGNKIYRQNLLGIYFNVVEQRFKKPMIAKVEADLQKFASGPSVNPGQISDIDEQNLAKNYDLLKAYLMLTNEFKAKAEPSHLVNTLKDYWVSESKVPDNLGLTAVAQLDFWAKQVDRDSDDFKFPRIQPNAKLVGDVREKLRAFPAWQRYYRGRVSAISKQIDDQVGRTTANDILARDKSDTSLLEGNYVVPSAYTRPGYELMKIAFVEANEKLGEPDWVMGEAGKSVVAQTTDVSKVQDQYFKDYADNWRNFVKNINVKTYKNKDEAANALQTFSSANSPMRMLLIEIARNTNLSAKLDSLSWWDWIKSFFSSSNDNAEGNTTPEKEFRPLFTFVGVGAKDQKANLDVDKYQTLIGNVFKNLFKVSQGDLPNITQQMANEQDPLGIKPAETGISNLVQSFSQTTSSQEIQTLLNKPLGNLKDMLGAGQKQQITKAWAEQVLPTAKDAEKGYPYDEGDAEADMTKLTAYLNPNDGTFSKFYKDRLEKYFEESNGQLKVKDTAPFKNDFTPEFIAYLNKVMALRKALFGTSPTPKFEYEFSFAPVSGGAVVEVSIDGQTLDSGGTNSLKGVFPAATGSTTGVSLKLASGSGSAPAAPASNTSSNSKPSSPSGGDANLSFGGTWGLFRFVDRGKPQKQATGEYLLTYSVGGKGVSAKIKPSGGDLFDKTIFSNAKAPQNLFK